MHRVLFVVSLAACTDTYVPPEQGDRNTGRAVVLHEDTVLLDDQAGQLTVADDHLWVDDAGRVEVGSVVVGQREGGYLRRVVDIGADGGGVRLDTEPAGLRDALLEAHVHTAVPVGRRSVQRWDFDTVVLADEYVSSSLGSGHVTATLDDTWVEFEPMLTVDLELTEDDEDASVRLGFVLGGGTDLVVAADGALAHSGEVELLDEAIPFQFAIGPVPVVGTADLTVAAGYDAWAEGQGEVGVHGEGEVEAEVAAGWAWGELYGDYDATSSFVVEPWSSVDGGGAAEVYLTGDVGATLYGTTSVYATVTPWMRGEVCEVDSWRVDAGVDGDMTFDLQVFGWSAWTSDPIELVTWQTEVADSEPGVCL